MNAFAPVATPAVVMVTVPASTFAEAVAIVGTPANWLPLMSALHCELAAAVVDARVTSKPDGKVTIIWPPSGIEVAARKFIR